MRIGNQSGAREADNKHGLQAQSGRAVKVSITVSPGIACQVGCYGSYSWALIV